MVNEGCLQLLQSSPDYSQQVIRFHLKCSTSHIFILQDLSGCWDGRPFGHNRHGQKSGRLLCPCPWGQLDPYLTQVAWTEAYVCTKWQLDPSSRLAIAHGLKIGGGCASFWGELGPHLTQCGLVRGLLLCQVASWSIQLFGHSTVQQCQTDSGLIA